MRQTRKKMRRMTVPAIEANSKEKETRRIDEMNRKKNETKRIDDKQCQHEHERERETRSASDRKEGETNYCAKNKLQGQSRTTVLEAIPSARAEQCQNRTTMPKAIHRARAEPQ